MKLVKRKKFSRMRGTRTHGWAMKKHKGKGNRGGVGMSGTGKRADQKKTLINKLYKNKYFGKSGITSRKTQKIKKYTINLQDIEKKFPNQKEISLEKYKILGQGEINSKLIIKAGSASKSAIEKIKKLGGNIILPEKLKPSQKKGRGGSPKIEKKNHGEE